LLAGSLRRLRLYVSWCSCGSSICDAAGHSRAATSCVSRASQAAEAQECCPSHPSCHTRTASACTLPVHSCCRMCALLRMGNSVDRLDVAWPPSRNLSP
jgi:hypothetical protein